jgi:hypothetical protein
MDEWLKNLVDILRNIKTDNTKVNIYRGEPKPEFLPKDKLNKDTGRWFSADKSYANKYANKPNHHLITEKVKVKDLANMSKKQLLNNLTGESGKLTSKAKDAYNINKKFIKPRIRTNVRTIKDLSKLSDLQVLKHDRKLISSILSKILRFGTGGVGALGGMFYKPGNIMSEEEEMRMLYPGRFPNEDIGNY